MKPIVYLAGSAQEISYRDYVIKKYGRQIIAFDPLREIEKNIDRSNSSFKEIIVNKDKDKIANDTHILVAYVKKSTFGTTMEILGAYDNNIPVFCIIPDDDGTLKNDIWLSHHTTKFFNTIDECFKFIISCIPS